MATAQYGHWKSENSTMVILAFAGPIEGAPATGIRTASSRIFASCRCAHFEESSAPRVSALVLPAFTDSTAVIARLVLYAQPGSMTRHSASFMLQPQEQGRSR